MGGTSSVEKIVRRGRLKTGRERDWRDRLSEREKKGRGKRRRRKQTNKKSEKKQKKE